MGNDDEKRKDEGRAAKSGSRHENADDFHSDSRDLLDRTLIDAEEIAIFYEKYDFSAIDSDAFDSEMSTPARHKGGISYSEPLKEEYAHLWAEMAIRRDRLEIATLIAKRVAGNKVRYSNVESSTRVPWYVIGVIHMLEASGDFHCHLHNGDPLSARTVQVPAGRPKTGNPPFTWEQSAADALTYDGLTGVTDWTIEHIAYLLERFNGWGCRLYHPSVKTPYLWSFSNLYTKGKYTRDRHWDDEAVSRQCGAMVILKILEQNGAIRLIRSRDLQSMRGAYSPNPYSRSSDDFFSGNEYGEAFDSSGDSLETDGQDVEILSASDAPLPVPRNNPVPFARSTAPIDAMHWPVITNNRYRDVVSYRTIDNRIISVNGRDGRTFLGNRPHGRFHVAIDLWADHRDEVVACEDGRIVNFYHFYPSSAGEMTYALLIEHSDFVVNYGEVKQDAPREFGWRIGSQVKAGQRIARVSTTSMLHFETYVLGTRQNCRWYQNGSRPRELLNPTEYLLRLRDHTNMFGGENVYAGFDG